VSIAIPPLSPSRLSLPALLSSLTFTIRRLKAEPLAAPLAHLFDNLRIKSDLVHTKELSLDEELADVQARITVCDKRLDELAGRCAEAIRSIAKEDRDHPLYELYFQRTSLDDFSRPILGEQLKAMRGWLVMMAASRRAALSGLGPEIALAIGAADAALQARYKVEREIRRFREGERRKLFDAVNALRRSAHGQLVTLGHAGLADDFASSFFQPELAAAPAGAEDGALAAA
jgi:hypothetical protein